MKKYNFNLPEELVEAVDVEADVLHMNRTQYVIRSLQQMSDTDRMLRSTPDLQKKIAEINQIVNQIAPSISK